jgi:hypothetical protein
MDIKRIEAIAKALPDGGFSFQQDGASLMAILELADEDFFALPAKERVAYLSAFLKMLDRKFGWKTALRLGESPVQADIREGQVYQMLATLYVLQASGVLVK